MSQPRFFIGLIALISLAGCANLSHEVSKRSDAPDWFKVRVKEIEKHGYPKFAKTDMTPRPRKTESEWAEVKADLENAKATLDSDTRAVNPGPLRDTASWTAAQKQKVETVGVEP